MLPARYEDQETPGLGHFLAHSTQNPALSCARQAARPHIRHDVDVGAEQ